MIVAITGHRPDKLGGYNTPNRYYNSVMEGLDRAFLRLRPERVRIGMALGVDQWAAELCIYNNIPFDAAIPFNGFESHWPPHAQIKYRELLRHATTARFICSGGYAGWKMQARNEWMVDNSDLLVAVWDGTTGGTANCVNYALTRGRPIERVEFLRPPQRTTQDQPRSIGMRPVAPIIRPATTLRELPVPVRNIRPETTPGQEAGRRRARQEMMADEEALNRQARIAEDARAR